MIEITRQLIAETTLVGMAFDGVGGCYLAYDLLGGKHGPLRILTRSVGYIALFFIGYALVLGLNYALVASVGMGIVLGIEYKYVIESRLGQTGRHPGPIFFGVMRGIVLGLAGMTIAGPLFGLLFGSLLTIGLTVANSIAFAQAVDAEAQARPRISRQALLMSGIRALAVSLAAVLAAAASKSVKVHGAVFGLKLGLAAGVVSALVTLYAPVIEWNIDNLPERRLGVIGLIMIFIGMTLQSAQYLVVVLNVAVH